MSSLASMMPICPLGAIVVGDVVAAAVVVTVTSAVAVCSSALLFLSPQTYCPGMRHLTGTR